MRDGDVFVDGDVAVSLQRQAGIRATCFRDVCINGDIPFDNVDVWLV